MVLSKSALILIALCSMLWAALDLTRKLSAKKFAPEAIVWLVTVGPLIVFGIWYLYEGTLRIPSAYILPGAVSLVLTAGGNYLFVRSVALAPLSRTVPMLSLTPVAASVSGLFVGEFPTLFQWSGIVMVVVGGILVALQRRYMTPPDATWHPNSQMRGVLLMALAALGWGIALPFDKLAMGISSIATHGFVISTFSIVVFSAMAYHKGSDRLVHHSPALKEAIAVPIISGAAFALQLYAVSIAPVGLFEALKRGIGVCAAVAFGRHIFNESITPMLITGCLTMILGVCFILC